MTLREKLMHYTHDLDCGADLKQEAIATIENIAQYMDEDKLLHHSRPLALAYLALTKDAPVVRCKDCKHLFGTICTVCGLLPRKPEDFCSYGERKDGGEADNGK